MQRPTWATRPVLVVTAVVLLALGVVVAIVSIRSETKTGNVASDVAARIPAGDGVTLSAEVISPEGSGPFPLVVMPASWGSGANEYRIIGRQLASAGYQVVSYAQRGFKGSGGAIDFAGARTRDDVSTVIDWALDHTRADGKHIGMLGVSYGASISLLAAAHDNRIRAVVAMSGWTDLAAAFVPHGTPNVQALHAVLDPSLAAGTLDNEVRRLAEQLTDQPAQAAAQLEQLSPSRSPAGELRALNRNKPAIMLASAYADSLIDPSRLVSFFARLHTPKRLQLSPGEHTGPELSGLLGKPDPTTANATEWLEHYLGGTANGIDRAGPILLQDGATGAWHTYPAWPTTYRSAQLATPGTPDNLVTSAVSPWTRSVRTGTDSGATSGRSFTKAPLQYQATTVPVSSVRSADAYVWTAAAVPNPALVSGTPTLKVDVSSSTPTTTLYAYLYDVDTSGSATLMSYAPATTASGGVTMTLRPVSWTVAAGHHVALVVDTVDERYASAAPSGSTLTLSSPASLAVPFG